MLLSGVFRADGQAGKNGGSACHSYAFSVRPLPFVWAVIVYLSQRLTGRIFFMSTYDNITEDPFYRTNMAPMFGRWQKLAESPAFMEAFGAQAETAKEQLMDALYGMQDAYSGYVEDIRDGIRAAQGLKSFLGRKLPNGKTFYDALKQTAKQNKVPLKSFYEDLHYMNEKLDLGMDMQKLDPELVVPKVRGIGEYNWENYAKAHLVSPPYSPKQKREYLAMAMAGAFLAGEKKRNPNAKETEFSKANAAAMTKYILGRPAFSQLAQDPNMVDKLLEKGAKDPDRLFDEAVRLKRPFYNIGADKPWTVNELATTVCKAMGAEASAIQHLDARNEVVTAYSSHEKVKRVFGDLIHNVPLDEGIAKMAAWVKTLKTIPEPKRFGHIEVLKNLPPSWAKLV